MKTNTIITIGRQYGSGGKEIGHFVAEAFGIKLYDKEISVTPFVLLEHFECEGNKLAVTAKVVENLGVGLC